ncbi:MAG: alpha/beta fold hydrolase, partial [Comamonas sp.]
MIAFPPDEIQAAAALIADCDRRATHHVLDLGGCETRWRVWGSGTPLVLIHGGHGAWTHWIRNIEALAAHFRVIVPDLAGFGDSADFAAAAHAPERLELLVESLRLGVEHLAPEGPLHLAGFSFGGAVAGLLAPRLAATPEGSDIASVDMLTEARIGLNILQLRRARHGLPPTSVE